MELSQKYKIIADSIRAYPFQLEASWRSVNSINFPEDYFEVRNVILAGMGGSALGGRIVHSFLASRLRVPFEISSSYHAPNYLNQDTLVISSSYSGKTEETLNFTNEAINKKAKIFGITKGSTLMEIFKKRRIPFYQIDETLNPSKQPRMSLGFSIGAILGILNKLGLANISQEEIDLTLSRIYNVLGEYHEDAPSERNLAKSYANKLQRKVPVFIASEHLIGVSYAIRNQLNENAKTFSLIFDIPELNHHLMEGLLNPAKIKQALFFIFIDSKLYSKEVGKRYPLTQEVISKNAFEYLTFVPYTQERLSQIFEVLIFGSFLALFLAQNYKVDVIDIPWVNYFKKKLSQK